ncbi:MAG: sulfatase [Bryobacterales bacterium]|nr:sulfatase [Bryobacterales bacterium]
MRKRTGLLKIGGVLLCAAVSTAVWSQTRSPSAEGNADKQRPHVVLITVDTLRADHLSSYGYHLKTSPVMDQLAEDGVRFDRAYSAIPMTGPSHFSMFTGRYPQEHGARINGVSLPGNSKWLTVPQVLRRFGYTSGAFVSAWPLVGRLTRLDRHFDHYYDEEMERSYQLVHSMRWAEDVTGPALRWLDEHQDEQSLFLWVHYFDPHEPYNLRKEFADPEQIREPHPESLPKNEEIANRVRKYDSEIGYADRHIGRLLDRIDKLGMRDNTLVVLLSDHGEGLGEQGFVGHGRWLYESTVHVPWIMRLPGTIDPGTVIDRNVSIMDLAPTLLDLAVPEFREESELTITFAGRSQVAAITQDAEAQSRQVRFVSFDGKKGFLPKWVSWIWTPNSGLPFRIGKLDGNMKVIWTPGEERFEVFDLAQDPFEVKTQFLVANDRRYKFEEAAFERWFEATDLAESESRLTKRDTEILKSLGYIND